MKKTLCLIAALLMLAAVFVGCAKSESVAMDTDDTSNTRVEAGESADYDYAEAPAAEPTAEVTEEEAAASTGLGEAKYTENDRKLIYTSDYSMETKAFEDDYNRILAALDKSGGFISSEETRGTKPEVYGDSGRNAYFVLRIPMNGYNEFLSDLEGVGSLLSKSRSTEDVTASYYDNEARIELYEAHYDKLMGYLKAATEMEDILAIENQITDVLYTLDELKGNKRYMDDRIEYCTVNITLTEVVEYTEVATSKQTFGERVGESFTAVIKWLGRFFEGFAVVFIAALPVLAILAAIFCAIFFPVRASKRRKAKRRAAAQKEQESDKR